MLNRLNFQAELEQLLGSEQVYFQSPGNVNMVYPAIVYNLSTVRADHADDISYRNKIGYLVTLIDKNPSSVHFVSLLEFRHSQFDRFFRSDKLNHFVFTIYF